MSSNIKNMTKIKESIATLCIFMTPLFNKNDSKMTTLKLYQLTHKLFAFFKFSTYFFAILQSLFYENHYLKVSIRKI